MRGALGAAALASATGEVSGAAGSGGVQELAWPGSAGRVAAHAACLSGGKGVLVWDQVLAVRWLLGKEPPAWSCSASGSSERSSKSLRASAENTGSPVALKHGLRALLAAASRAGLGGIRAGWSSLWTGASLVRSQIFPHFVACLRWRVEEARWLFCHVVLIQHLTVHHSWSYTESLAPSKT